MSCAPGSRQLRLHASAYLGMNASVQDKLCARRGCRKYIKSGIETDIADNSKKNDEGDGLIRQINIPCEGDKNSYKTRQPSTLDEIR